MTNDLLSLIAILQLASLILAVCFSVLQSGAYRRQAEALAEAENVLEAWYVHATQVHRESKARQDLVPDALAWIGAQVKEELGAPLEISSVTRVVPDLRSLEAAAADGRRVVVSPLNAAQLRRARRPRPGIRTFADAALLDGTPGVITVERSVLISDYFDLEAAQAGAKLKVPGWDALPRLYFHVLPAYR